MLNLFYKEPEGDRWLPFDRYPRQAIRRLVRGQRKPGGMERYFLNLVDGLDRISVPYQTNAFRYAKQHPQETIGILGKGHLLRNHHWQNPIVFGPAVFSHPIDDLNVFTDVPIKKILVSCEWMKKMYESHVKTPISVWAAGIDTYKWVPAPEREKEIDVLVYDKIRWERDKYEPDLLNPIMAHLKQAGLKCQAIRYGFYEEEDYRELLQKCRCQIFLVEHETQGFAYLQALASGVPLLAWDRGGPWKDPFYFPQKIKFGPVTSVPYWDERCGQRFFDFADFRLKWDGFWADVQRNHFAPRDYVLENLTLEKCAANYVEVVHLS